MALHKNALAYATTEIAASMMNSIFTFYYVKLFLNTYKISQEWFNVAQIIYLLWNAINDPLFAYFQDNSTHSIFKRRRYSILFGAPVFALSFLLPWFPWAEYKQNDWLIGVHLLVSVCAYDALFTFVLLAQCTLYAEMSKHHDDRLRLTRYGVIGNVIGSSSVFWCELLSNSLNNFRMFQIVCVLVALLSWLAMSYTGLNARSEYDVDVKRPTKDVEQEVKNSENEPPLSIFRGYWQIFRQRNVLILVMVNFCTEFHMTYGRNFLSILANELLPSEQVSDFVKKLLYGSVFVLPQVFVLLWSPVVQKVGAFKLYQMTFYIKICTAILMYLIGPSHPWILVCFILVDTIVPNATSRYLGILMSDCIDDDLKKYRRSSPRSSMFFGTNALFTKPAQSLAPMLVVAILNENGYEQVKIGEHFDPDVISQLHSVMFQIICLFPLVLGLVQALIWTKYTLRDSHLKILPKYVDG